MLTLVLRCVAQTSDAAGNFSTKPDEMNEHLIADTVSSSHHQDLVNELKLNRNSLSIDAAKERDQWEKRRQSGSLSTKGKDLDASALTESLKHRAKGG